jgi:hypothetical protein
MTSAPPCPKCQSTAVVPIMYGMPSRDPRPRFHPGGCVVTDNDPEWHCNACGLDFGRPNPAIIVERPDNHAGVRLRFDMGSRARKQEEEPKPVRAWFVRWEKKEGSSREVWVKEREMTLEEAAKAPETMNEQECQNIMVEFSNGAMVRPYRFVDAFYE